MKPAAPLASLASAVQLALTEDLGREGDITTEATIPPGTTIQAVVRSRQSGRIAGVACIGMALSNFAEPANVTVVKDDGADVAPQDVVARISGSARTVLTAERTFLNILGRLSGIATATAAAVRLTNGYRVAVKDTRKTTPGLRSLEKYAVAVGGGVNHRFGLYDAILVKDNHIALAGSITLAVQRLRSRHGTGVPVQVEVESMAELDEALRCKVDAVLLDNFLPEDLRRAVTRAGGRCQLEASGGITLTNIREIAATGVDAVSLGWLTHSAQVLDLGLDIAGAAADRAS